MPKAYIIAIIGFLIWGNMPLYFSPLSWMPLEFIVSARILTGFLFVFFLLLPQGKWPSLWRMGPKQNWIWLLCSTILLLVNWSTYLYAVKHHHLVQASLGYFIAPLVSVSLAWFWFKEPYTKFSVLAVVCACLGVSWMVIRLGEIPWLGLCLAVTISIYAALHKAYIHRSSVESIAIETTIMLPLVLCSSFFLWYGHSGASDMAKVWSAVSPIHGLLMAGSGIITVVPLICYSYASKHIPFASVGILSYISPTILLFNAMLWFREPMEFDRWISFILIWTGLILYVTEQLRIHRRSS